MRACRSQVLARSKHFPPFLRSIAYISISVDKWFAIGIYYAWIWRQWMPMMIGEYFFVWSKSIQSSQVCLAISIFRVCWIWVRTSYSWFGINLWQKNRCPPDDLIIFGSAIIFVILFWSNPIYGRFYLSPRQSYFIAIIELIQAIIEYFTQIQTRQKKCEADRKFHTRITLVHIQLPCMFADSQQHMPRLLPVHWLRWCFAVAQWTSADLSVGWKRKVIRITKNRIGARY